MANPPKIPGRLREPIRIGDPESLVQPGDPVPGKPGHYYEAGQYAPSPERLSALKIAESVRSGLLPTILDDDKLKTLVTKNGEVDTKKLKSFDFKPYFERYGFEKIDDNLPEFAAIGLISTFLLLPEETVKYANFKEVKWHGLELTGNENIDIYARNELTGITKRGTEHILHVYQPFFVYMSVPIVPGIPGRSSGLSAASVSTIKTIGVGVFRRLRVRNTSLYNDFLRAGGWKKKSELLSSDSYTYFPAGSEIGLNRKTSWYRNIYVRPISVNSVLSPMEMFSEAFLYYWTHRVYFARVNKELYQTFERIIEYITESEI